MHLHPDVWMPTKAVVRVNRTNIVSRAITIRYL